MASKFANPDLKTTFTAWLSRDGQQQLSILLTGKTGVGKSRLVNALVGNGVALEGQQKKPCTATVNEYRTVVNDTQVLVWDSPGLQDGKCNEQLYLEDMREKLHEGLDLMIYCIKMDDKRFHKDDKDAIRTLTREFGKNLWKNSVIALTFANKIDDPDEGDEREYFLRDLKFWKNEIGQFLASDSVLELNSTIRDEIPVVPVGIAKKLCLPTIEDWFANFWLICYRRMKISSRVALLRINKDRCKFPDSRRLDAICGSAEMTSTLTSESAEREEIPDEIPLNQEQHKQFWSLTWEAFKLYCINILKRPDLVGGAVSVGVLLMLLEIKLK